MARTSQSRALEAIELLTSVGKALSAERDHDRLMELILRTAKELSRADGGTVYSRTADDHLEFEIMLTDSLGLCLGGTSGKPITYPPLPLRDESGEPNEHMVAACAAISGATVNVPDAYDAREFDFSGTREFDARTGYRSKSFLTVPMKNDRDEVIGVLQLINAQDPDTGEVVAFTLEDQRLVESLASQAAITLTKKRLIEELREAKEAAEESSRLKSEFVANMSHELRTPMTVIIGMTKLALERDLEGDLRDMLGSVASSADSLLHVLNDVLDFSKIEAGKLELNAVAFDLRETVGDALRTLAEKAHAKRLELLCSIADKVPRRVVGDFGRLRQVLVNLVGNAIKFTDAGQVMVTAYRTGRRGGDEVQVHFQVADTGCGIASEKQKLVFQSFTQADGSTTRTYGGTGLGLSISKELVAMMGGKIWVESAPGKGSTFHFTARFGQVDDGAAEAALRPDLAGVRTLVVDDNAASLRITSTLLEKWGMRVDTTSDGAAALERLLQAARGGDPHRLVLLDAVMPEVDGFELADRIRRHEELSPPGGSRPAGPSTAIMLSSHGDARRWRDLGIAGYLVKPVLESDLHKMVLSVLGHAPARERPPAPAPPPSTASLDILVAEDSAMNRKLLRRLLGNAGHRAVITANGKEALAAFEREPFDVILMDVQMPELGGLETTREIRRREASTGAHTPIVALTASAMKGDRERFLEAGMDAYVAKPIDKKMLFDVIDGFAAPASAAAAVPAAPDPRAAARVFDPQRTLAQCDDDPDLARDMVELFIETADDLTGRLEGAVAAADAAAIHRLAHTLKGSAANVCGGRVEAVAWELMKMGAEGDLDRARPVLARLDDELARLEKELTAFRAGLE